MNTLTEGWRDYRDTVYPDGMAALQNRECHKAFMAGALVAMGMMSKATELPEDQAVVKVQALFTEAAQFTGDLVKQNEGRN